MLTRRTVLAGGAAQWLGGSERRAARAVRWDDLPPMLQRETGSSAESFDRFRAALDAATDERLRRGEDEHLAYYVLQSRHFTSRGPIEPALAAARPELRAAADGRARDFLAALNQRDSDERIEWWRTHLPPSRRTPEGIGEALQEAAAFLRAKEVEGRGPAAYQTRGHSSDTSLAPGYTVWSALQVIARVDPRARLERVLLIGPGLDWAPRTGLRDGPPRSYQPYLTVDAVLQAGQKRAAVTCADINERVLAFIRRSPRTVMLPREPGTEEYRAYQARLGEKYRVPDGAAFPFETVRMNAATERLERTYDLVVATNVLVYFARVELALALANTASMLRSGGWFVHNELRPELEEMARAAGIPAVQGRTLEIAKGTKAPLGDAAVMHRRE